jgi:hypothetical protein
VDRDVSSNSASSLSYLAGPGISNEGNFLMLLFFLSVTLAAMSIAALANFERLGLSAKALVFVILAVAVAVGIAWAVASPAITATEQPRTPDECTLAGGSIVYTYAMLPNFGGPAPDGSVREQIVGWKCEFSERAIAQKAEHRR